MKKIWYLPGFMEGEKASERLFSLLPEEFHCLHADYRPVLNAFPNDKFRVADFVSKLIDYYSISPDDIIIGHSTGGWIAAWVNHLQQNPVILLSAFTDRNKVMAKGVVHRPLLRRFLVKSGLYYSSFAKRRIARQYKNMPSREAVSVFLRSYDTFNKDYVLKMLNIIASKEKPEYKEILRLHGLEDRILAVPDEPFTEIPGDHFSLYTYPIEVVKPIAEALNKLRC